MINKPLFLVLNYTSDISGSSVSLGRLLDAIKDQVRFSLITSPDSYISRIAKDRAWDCIEKTIPVIDIHNIPLSLIKYVWQTIKLGWLIRRQSVKKTPDVILINSSINMGWIPGWIMTPAGSRPRIFWLVHELDIKPAWFFRITIQVIEMLADKVFCVSSPVQELFKKQTYLLPNIVPQQSENSFPNPLGSDKLELLWVASLSPRKGLHQLKKIIGSLSSCYNDIQLEMVVSLRNRYRLYFNNCLEELKTAGIECKVHENIPNPESFFSPEKILLQTSLAPESFSLTPLEAMGRGMLVFASGIGGINDYGIHEENIFFWENMKGSFGDAITELKNDPLKIKEIQKSAHQTSSKYSPEKIAEKFYAICK